MQDVTACRENKSIGITDVSLVTLFFFPSKLILLATYPSATSANIKQSIKCKIEIKSPRFLECYNTSCMRYVSMSLHCTGVLQIKCFKGEFLIKTVVFLAKFKDFIKF